MLFLYIYATIAVLGVMSMPSHGVYWKHKNRKRLEKLEKHYNKKLTWWYVDAIDGDIYRNKLAISLPVTFFFMWLFWPVTASVYGIRSSARLFSKVLSLPAHLLISKAQAEEERKLLMIEAEREADEVLRTSR